MCVQFMDGFGSKECGVEQANLDACWDVRWLSNLWKWLRSQRSRALCSAHTRLQRLAPLVRFH